MASGPRFYTPFFQAFDRQGIIIPGAELNFYLTESDTRAPTYTDMALTVENANPVIADDAGFFNNIFIDPTLTYRVVLTRHDDGITAPEEIWTADPYKLAWPVEQTVFWDMPFEWLNTTAAANEVMGMYTATRPQRIFGNFDGTGDGFKKAWGNWMTVPGTESIIWCNLNGVTPVGYQRIEATTGVVDFFTDGGAPIDLDAGEFITWAPTDTLTGLGIGAWTITGVNL